MGAIPGSLLTAALIFAGIMSSLAVDAGFVVVIPLGAVLFDCSSGHPLNPRGRTGMAGRGVCAAGTQRCNAGGTAWGACTGERLPQPETCNRLDDDCNGRVDELPSCAPLTATCPPPATGAAGTPVPLRASASQPGAACRWEVLSRPEGAGAEGTFANPSACDTTFSSVIVGVYTVRVTVTDANGRMATCMTTVTLTGRGMRVELTW